MFAIIKHDIQCVIIDNLHQIRLYETYNFAVKVLPVVINMNQSVAFQKNIIYSRGTDANAAGSDFTTLTR